MQASGPRRFCYHRAGQESPEIWEVRMKWLRKRHEDDTPKDAGVAPTPVCEHITLIPRWDSAESMGRDDAISRFRCDTCGAEFTPEEAARLRATEAARIQRRIAS